MAPVVPESPALLGAPPSPLTLAHALVIPVLLARVERELASLNEVDRIGALALTAEGLS